MGSASSEADRQLSAFIAFTRAAAKAFPELPGISERAIMLQALALADADGYVKVEAWAAHSGISVSTLERFAKHFASFGLIKVDEMSGGTVRLKMSAFARVEAAIRSESKQ